MSPESPGEITVLLQKVASGDRLAADRLAEAVYAELRRIARGLMAHERRDHTLQPTVIAGEAYVNLVEQRDRNWQNRAQFFAGARGGGRPLGGICGRPRRALRRGGPMQRIETDVPGDDL